MRMKSSIVMPGHVSIEVTNLCTGSCQLCPVGQRRFSRPFGKMPLERFKYVIDHISSFTRYAELYNWGDPILHPSIYDMISYAANKKIYTVISSTLRRFRTEEAERLIKSGLNVLSVSLHGLSENTYGDYQPLYSNSAMSYQEALHKVQVLVSAKRILRSTNPIIVIKSIVTRSNEHEIPRLPELSKSLGVDYKLAKASLNLRFLPYDHNMKARSVNEEFLCKERMDIIKRWLPLNDQYIHPYYIYTRNHNGHLPNSNHKWFNCIEPWYKVYICWDGDVNLCCGSYDPQHSVGNIFEQSLHSIWNNVLYRSARRSILGVQRETDPKVLCHECTGKQL
jgi:MoaA/NifB/PqqE/SkfB family radical SAM enzyme